MKTVETNCEYSGPGGAGQASAHQDSAGSSARYGSDEVGGPAGQAVVARAYRSVPKDQTPGRNLAIQADVEKRSAPASRCGRSAQQQGRQHEEQNKNASWNLAARIQTMPFTAREGAPDHQSSSLNANSTCMPLVCLQLMFLRNATGPNHQHKQARVK